MNKRNHALNPPLDLDDLFGGLGATILESIRTPFGIFSSDFRILWLNRALARIHGCHADSVIGETCHKAFHGCDKVCDDCFLSEVLERGRTVVLEKSHEFPDGTKRWGEIHSYPVRSKDRAVSAAIVIIFETTSRIQKLAQQKAYSAFLAERLTREESGKEKQAGSTGVPPAELPAALSRREIEVLRLVVDGYSNPQISEMLSISGNTVKRHMSNLFLKLDVSDRTQAAVLAVREKII